MENKKTFGMSIALFICGIIGMVLSGVVIVDMWEWFIASTFNIVSISLYQAIGIDLLISYLTYKTSDYLYVANEDALKDTVSKCTVCITSPLSVWFVAWIVHLCM